MTAINFSLVSAINEFVAAGKTPWLTIADDQVVGVYRNRDVAREVKNGKPVKYEAGMAFDVINDVAATLPTASDVADAMGFKAEKDDLSADLAPTVAPVPPVAAAPVLAADKPKADIRHQSEIIRPTKRVWAIADDMKALNADVTRKEILAECDRQGIAFFTARTQYQVWKSMQG